MFGACLVLFKRRLSAASKEGACHHHLGKKERPSQKSPEAPLAIRLSLWRMAQEPIGDFSWPTRNRGDYRWIKHGDAPGMDGELRQNRQSRQRFLWAIRRNAEVAEMVNAALPSGGVSFDQLYQSDVEAINPRSMQRVHSASPQVYPVSGCQPGSRVTPGWLRGAKPMSLSCLTA
jgi:hypothetical protein